MKNMSLKDTVMAQKIESYVHSLYRLTHVVDTIVSRVQL